MTEQNEHTTPLLDGMQDAFTVFAAELSRDAQIEAEQDVADVLELLAHAIRTGRTGEMLAMLLPHPLIKYVAERMQMDDAERESAIAGLRLPDAYSGLG